MAKRCVASGLAELNPSTCWDLCVSGSPQASPRKELIDPGMEEGPDFGHDAHSVLNE